MPATVQDSNPFLTTLTRASSTLAVTVADDICDSHGIKLISAGQILTANMLARLAQRESSRPLESSVCVNGGVTPDDMACAATRVCQGSIFIATIVGTGFTSIKRAYHTISLPPFFHLMLSIQQATYPGQFAHGILCSLVASLLARMQGGPNDNAHLAMLAALAHDLGEMYGNPDHKTLIAGASRDRWQTVVAHPTIGKRLIERFTDCPASIAQAVGEHHERLDGSGYPRGISGEAISPLGRVLGLADTICGVIKAPGNHGARAKLAVSFVPGEFDPSLVRRFIETLAGTSAAEIALPASFDAGAARERAKQIGQGLENASHAIATLASAPVDDPHLAKIVAFAQQRIGRLKLSWDATGIDAYCALESAADTAMKIDEESYFDVDVVARELVWRMRSLSRRLVILRHQYRLDGYGALEPAVAALELE